MNEVKNEVKSEAVKALEAVAQPKGEAYRMKREEVEAKFKAILEAALEDSGVKGLAVRVRREANFDIINVNSDFHRMEVCAEERFFCEGGDRREFKFSVGGYGSTGKDDPMLPVFQFAGYMASHFKMLEAAVLGLDWEGLRMVDREASKAWEAVRQQEQKEEAEAKARKVAESEANIVVGKVLAKKSWYNRFSLVEVERVTNKLVYFKGAYGQFKKAEVAEALASGREWLVPTAEQIAEAGAIGGEFKVESK